MSTTHRCPGSRPNYQLVGILAALTFNISSASLSRNLDFEPPDAKFNGNDYSEGGNSYHHDIYRSPSGVNIRIGIYGRAEPRPHKIYIDYFRQGTQESDVTGSLQPPKVSVAVSSQTAGVRVLRPLPCGTEKSGSAGWFAGHDVSGRTMRVYTARTTAVYIVVDQAGRTLTGQPRH